MRKEIYAMFDSAVQSYMQPIFADAKGQVLRSLMDIVQDDNHEMSKHREDYTCFKIGEYDQQSGMIEAHTPQKVIGLWELKDPQKEESYNG